MTKTMTLSEAVSLAKQKENEVYKLTQLRKSIVQQPFDEKKYLGLQEEYSAEEFNEKKEKFIEEKIKRLEDVENQIENAIQNIILIRNAVNRKNIELGQDKNLIKMKWLRIQLDNLMKDLGHKKRDFYSDSSMLDQERYETLGLGKKLKELEREKNKLDAKIQKINHTTEITLDI